VIWAGHWSVDPGDEFIPCRAWGDKPMLVVLDKDFGELGVSRQAPRCGLIRLVNFRAAQQGRVCLHILAGHGDDLGGGAIITAEPGRSGSAMANSHSPDLNSSLVLSRFC
jgi:predicted nuclease of predicted toxin-antitoxin system